MYGLIQFVDSNFYFVFILVFLALLRTSVSGVLPLIIIGFLVLGVTEWMYLEVEEYTYWEFEDDVVPVQWLRFLIALLWLSAAILGWYRPSYSDNTSLSGNSDLLLPSVPVSEPNYLSKAEQFKQKIVRSVESLATEKGIEAHVLSSPPYSADHIIHIEVSREARGESGLFNVSSSTIVIQPTPYRRLERLFDISIDTGMKRKTYRNVSLLGSGKA